MSELPALIKAITVDGFAGLLGQPPTATFSELFGSAYQNWLNKKARAAHQILLIEIHKGKRLANDVDPESFFGLLHRYLNATKQGAARRNLRLMAQVLKGSLEQDCGFTPDELASSAESVATLSRNEIKFLATMWRCRVECLKVTENEDINVKVHSETFSALVPQIYPNKNEFFAAGGALTRTGLIIAQSVWGGTRFDTTNNLSRLVQLCDLESEIVDDEGGDLHY